MTRITITFLICLFVSACNDSTESSTEEGSSTQPNAEVSINVTVPKWLHQQDLEIYVFKSTETNELINQSIFVASDNE